jgi:hypothetical protein
MAAPDEILEIFARDEEEMTAVMAWGPFDK